MDWVCEWHSGQAAQIVRDEVQKAGLYPERVICKFCQKCHCVAYHALIEEQEVVKENDK